MDLSDDYNIVELKKSFLIYFKNSEQKISFSNQDIYNPTNSYIGVTLNKWHFVGLSSVGDETHKFFVDSLPSIDKNLK